MSNEFPKSYEALLVKLEIDGCISVEFEEKNKRRLKTAFGRINKMDTLLARRNKFMGVFIYYVYGAYVGLIDLLFSPKDQGFDHALLIYTVAWQKISKLRGESLDNGKARVTFYART